MMTLRLLVLDELYRPEVGAKIAVLGENTSDLMTVAEPKGALQETDLADVNL